MKQEIVPTVLVELAKVQENRGQVDGLPANPRTIDPDALERLKQSIRQNPEMMEARPVVLFAVSDGFVVIAGEMRCRALREMGAREVHAKILTDATPEQLKAYTIKDNLNFGDWNSDGLAAFEDVTGEWAQEEKQKTDRKQQTPPNEEKEVLELTFSPDDFVEVKQALAKVDGDSAAALLKLLQS